MSSPAAGRPAGATANSVVVLDKITDFVRTHKRSLLISLTIIAAAGTTIYFTRPTNDGGSNDSSERSTSKEKKKKRDAAKRSKKNKKKQQQQTTGENRSQPTSAQDGHNSNSGGVNTQTSSEDEEEIDPIRLTADEIRSLSSEERARHAFTLKTNGNKAYQSKNFQEAIQCYSKAIECEEKAVYYSNRAACYTNLNDSEAVIRDCTAALKLDKHYIKALNRRAAARELLGGEENLFLALCDFTACVILDEFKTDTKGATADRVMKRYASEKAHSILKERAPRLPSGMIIRAYLDAFRQKPRPDLPVEPNQADQTLMLAYDALAVFDYTHACSLFNEAVAQSPSTSDLRAHAHMMKGTFLFLMGQSKSALDSFNQALEEEPQLQQAWVRKASVDMELGSLEAAMNDFQEALKLNPDDPDVYYHRGQVYNVTEQHEQAIQDYRRSLELDRTFIFSHVQLAVAIYKTGQVAKAMEMFKRYLKADGEESKSPEVHNYYGELLFAEERFDEALERFESAIALENERPGPKNVLPWVNKALVHATAKNDLKGAAECCENAIKIDPSCEVAIQQLAQLKLQVNETKEAIEWYRKGIEISMTEIGLVQLLQFEAAARAQLKFVEDYPEYAARLGLQ